MPYKDPKKAKACWDAREKKAERREYKRLWHHTPAGRNQYLKSRYGISQTEYDALLIKQGGGCAICGRASIQDKWFAVDHDHATGKVRGLLCKPCNLAIGLFQDSVETLRKAVNYFDSID